MAFEGHYRAREPKRHLVVRVEKGRLVIGTSEYFANMPPAQCDGGDLCRGFYIPVGRG